MLFAFDFYFLRFKKIHQSRSSWCVGNGLAQSFIYVSMTDHSSILLMNYRHRADPRKKVSVITLIAINSTANIHFSIVRAMSSRINLSIAQLPTNDWIRYHLFRFALQVPHVPFSVVLRHHWRLAPPLPHRTFSPENNIRFCLSECQH